MGEFTGRRRTPRPKIQYLHPQMSQDIETEYYRKIEKIIWVEVEQHQSAVDNYQHMNN